jgi:hypothetical protein
MSDGSERPLFAVRPGELVRGPYGEASEVAYLYITTLGERNMVIINGEHAVSDEHEHMRPDRTWAIPNMEALEAEIGLVRYAIDKTGAYRPVKLVGLPPGSFSRMEVGQHLLHEDGPRKIESIEIADKKTYPPSTLIGTLLLKKGTCRTFMVRGYAVAGDANHEEWDYERWLPK